jgi:hypothetical protein
MANVRRGEIEAELGNRTWRMVLTLGALAELEDSFGASDLTDLAERFAAGNWDRLISFASSVADCGAPAMKYPMPRSAVSQVLTGWRVTRRLLQRFCSPHSVPGSRRRRALSSPNLRALPLG